MNERQTFIILLCLMFVATMWLMLGRGCEMHRQDLENRLDMEKVHYYGKPLPTATP